MIDGKHLILNFLILVIPSPTHIKVGTGQQLLGIRNVFDSRKFFHTVRKGVQTFIDLRIDIRDDQRIFFVSQRCVLHKMILQIHKRRTDQQCKRSDKLHADKRVAQRPAFRRQSEAPFQYQRRRERGHVERRIQSGQ